MHRRTFLTFSTALLGLAALPLRAWAALWNAPAFQANKLADAMHVLGADIVKPSEQVTIIAPDKAENGAVVQVQIRSALANTQSIALLVEKNPTVLIAQFDFMPGSVPEVITRIKMAETSDVIALVKADGGFYVSKKLVEVLENGCG